MAQKSEGAGTSLLFEKLLRCIRSEGNSKKAKFKAH